MQGSVLRGGEGAAAKWQPSAASELHDNVNIVVLSGLGAASIVGLFHAQDVLGFWLTRLGLAYIAFDTLWLFLHPAIVKSPSTILAHHLATLAVLLDPLLNPSHSVYTAACLIVEVNTVLLLLRRKLSYSAVVEVPFLITWLPGVAAHTKRPEVGDLK